MSAILRARLENEMKKYKDKITDKKTTEIGNFLLSSGIHNPSDILDLVKNNHRPSDMKMKTVGSYLAGCTMEWYGEDVRRDCSILCHGSLGDNNKCSSGMWIVDKKGTLKKIKESDNGECLIFLENRRHNLNKKNENNLWLAGCKNAKILETKYSKHYLVDEIPIKRVHVKQSNGWIFIFLIFVVVAIIFLYILRRSA